MLNYLWAFMVLAGTLYGMITGNVDKITDALLTGGGSAIDMAMTLFGVVALWTGLMNIAMKSGLINSIQEKLSPVVTFLFPTVPKEHRARKYITVNLVSNFLGLGVAATPAGLKAMEALSDLQDDKAGEHITSMSSAMCAFLVINISSIQLIPITVIAYRAQYGSINPAGIIIPGIITTSVSTLAGIIFAKIMEKKDKIVHKNNR